MKQFMNAGLKALLTLSVASLGLIVTPATAHADFLDFTVVEGTVPGAGANTFVADQVTGSYNEVIVLNMDGTFDATLYVRFSNYLSNEANDDPADQLGSFFPQQYGLYATVTATGTFSGTGAVADPFQFEPTDADAIVRVDPDSNTTFTFNAPGTPVTLGSDGDDYTIMLAGNINQALSFGNLISQGPVNGQGGLYNLVFTDPSLTDNGTLQDGESYWQNIPLFGLIAVNDGDFDDADISDGTLSGQNSLVFQTVPEPATLSLLGLGLLGAGAAARRRRNAQSIN